MSAVVDQDSVEADDAEVAERRLLSEAGGEGERIHDVVFDGGNWDYRADKSRTCLTLQSQILFLERIIPDVLPGV